MMMVGYGKSMEEDYAIDVFRIRRREKRHRDAGNMVSVS